MTSTLEIKGDFDAARVAAMRASLDQMADEDTDLVLDLSECRFIDSSGVGAIVFLYKRKRARGYRVTAQGLDGHPLRLLRHLGIAGLLAGANRKAA